MHLKIFVVLVVAALSSAQRRYYSLEDMPDTNFDCRDKILGGYYADPEANCQMFHVCVKIPGQGVQDFRFLCPNETAFDQENQICADSGDIDCEASGLYLENFDLYRIGSNQAKRPVPQVGNGKGAVLPLGPSTKSPILTNNVYEDDDFYLQRSESGDRRLHSKDLLRGSSSSNFFNNRNKGKDLEDDDDAPPKRTESNNNNNNNNNQFRAKPNPQLRPKTQYQSQFRKPEPQTSSPTTEEPIVGNQNQLNDKKRTKIAVRKLARKRPQDEAEVKPTQQPQDQGFSNQATQKFGVSDVNGRYSTINRPTTPAPFGANGEVFKQQKQPQIQQQQQQQQQQQNVQQSNFGNSNTQNRQFQQQQNAQTNFGSSNAQNRQSNAGATNYQQQQQNIQNANFQQQQQNAQAVNFQQQQQNTQGVNFQQQQQNVNFRQQQQAQQGQQHFRQNNLSTTSFQQQQGQQQQQTQGRFQNFKRPEQTTPAFFEPSPTAGAVPKSSEANKDTTPFSLLRNPIVAAGPSYNVNGNRGTTNVQQTRQSTVASASSFPTPTPASVPGSFLSQQQQQQGRQNNGATSNFQQQQSQQNRQGNSAVNFQQQQNRQTGSVSATGFSQQRQTGAFQSQQSANGGAFQQNRQQTNNANFQSQQASTNGAGFQQQNRQQTTVTSGGFQQQGRQQTQVNAGAFQQQQQNNRQQTQTNSGNFQQQGRQQTQVNGNGNFQQNRQTATAGQSRGLTTNNQQGFGTQQTFNAQQQNAQVNFGNTNTQNRQSTVGVTNYQQQSQSTQNNFGNANLQYNSNKQSNSGATNFQQQQQQQQAFNTQVNRQTNQRQSFNRNYEEFDDGDNQEFLKTAPSNNFRPSDINSFVNNYKTAEEKVNVTKFAEASTTKYITPTIVTTPRSSPAYDTPPQPRQNFFAAGQSSTGHSSSNLYTPTVSTTQRIQSGVSATSPAPTSKLPQRIYPSPTPSKATEAKDTAYDYAYYDDSGASFPDYGSFDHLVESDFSRTSQRTKSRLI